MQGIHDPAKGINVPASSLPTVYFDWAGGKVTVLHGDSDDIKYYPSLAALLDTLSQPHVIIGEATFESFDIHLRESAIRRAARGGHMFLVTPNRLTGRHRRAMGYEEKTDEIDVFVIRDLARTKPEVLKVPQAVHPGDVRAAVREAANHELMVLRRTRRMVVNRSKIGFKTVTAKDDYADRLIAELPPYVLLSETAKAALGDGKKYSKVIVAAVAMATKYSANRSQFDRLTGMYVHGYPSQIRSDVHHWRYRFAKAHGVSMSDFRREVRWLYHHLDKLRETL